MWKVYRLMVFNYLIEKKDDHAKNFAFIFGEGNWHFAPAYDLLLSDGIIGYRTTSINNSLTPYKADILSVAAKVGLSKKEAARTLGRMQDVVRQCL